MKMCFYSKLLQENKIPSIDFCCWNHLHTASCMLMNQVLHTASIMALDQLFNAGFSKVSIHRSAHTDPQKHTSSMHMYM